MRNDDPKKAIEEWSGHRESKASIIFSLILLAVACGGFAYIVTAIAENLIAKP